LQELQGLQGRHFKRAGYVWVSADIGKGGRERWIPVLVDLLPLVEDRGARRVRHPAERWRDPGHNKTKAALLKRPASRQAFRTVVETLGERAGIHAHLVRHAFADHVARQAGVRSAQFLLGHATLGTTEAYIGEPTLDELTAATEGVSFLDDKRTGV
jgi:site-specific recombinase XerD